MRILVVEDEHKITSFIKKGLEAERYAVDVDSDGQSGLELALVYRENAEVSRRSLSYAGAANVTRPCRFQGGSKR